MSYNAGTYPKVKQVSTNPVKAGVEKLEKRLLNAETRG